MKNHDRKTESRPFLNGDPIQPQPIGLGTTVPDLVDQTFLAYNAGRLREICRLFTDKMLAEDVTVGLSLSGALSPAGLGMSCLIPLIESGMIDWIVSTGANLYHDTHFGLGMSMHQGSPFQDDVELRKEKIIRIYDILFDNQVLVSTDIFYQEVITAPEFQKTMGTAEFHHLFGRYVAERERALGLEKKSFLSATYRCGVPVYTSSPGDSSIGMNVSEKALEGNKLQFDPSVDVNETSAIVLDAKDSGGKSAAFILGGGSPKNFLLQTEPYIQEVLGISDEGFDYFAQITDARPDTGGLSGATPDEAVSWGKVEPSSLPNSIVCYCDSTIALPILTAYALTRRGSRPLKRLYDRRGELLENMNDTFKAFKKRKKEIPKK